MKRNTLVKYSLVLCLVGITATQAIAYTSFGTSWLNTYPEACQELQDAASSEFNCIICHGSGFSLNPYGDDFNENGRDYAAIESFDSDGDGRTNAQEILEDCSLPGDAVSPVDLDSWGHIKALFR